MDNHIMMYIVKEKTPDYEHDYVMWSEINEDS